MNYFWNTFRSEIKAILVYASVVGVLSLVTPLAVQALVNSIAFTGLLQPILVLSGIVLVLTSLNIVLKIFKYWIAELIERKVFTESIERFKKGTLQNQKVASTLPKPAQALRLFESITLKKSITFLLLDGIGFILQATVGTILLAFYHPYFLTLAIALIVTTFWIIRAPFQLGLETAIKESEEKHLLISALNAGESDVSQKSYLEQRSKHFKILLFQKASALTLQIIFSALVLGVGGFLVLKQLISLGQLVAAELIVSTVVGQYDKLGKILENIYDLLAAKAKLTAVIPDLDQPFDPDYPQSVSQYLNPLHAKKYILRPAKITAITAGVIVAGLIFVPWQQTSFGEGRVVALSPTDRETFIDAPVDGRLGKWFVQEGSFVKENDPIVEIFDNDPDILDRLNREKEAILARLRAARASAEASRRNVDRQKALFDEGISSRRQLELAEIEYAKHLSEEASASADLARIETRLARQTNQSVRAPRSGYVLRRKAGEISVQVKAGDWLATLVPETDSRAVEIYVPGIDIALIRIGQAARIQFEGWPALQFSGWPEMSAGTFEGKVAVIDAAESGNGKFRVLITPLPGKTWPDRDLLRQGVRAMAWIQLGRVSMGYEIWRRMNGFPPLPVPINSDQENNKKS